MYLSCPDSILYSVPANAMVFPDRTLARWYHETGQLQNAKLVNTLLESVLVPGRNVVDVGSFVGGLAVGLGRSDKVNRVWAFESNPRLFACLVSNVGFARLQDKVVCFKDTIGDTFRDTEWFMRSEDGFSNGTRILTPGKCEFYKAWDLLPLKPLDSYAFLANVGCLIVDVSGSELDVLKGAVSLIRRDRPMLVVTSWGMYKRPRVPAVKEMREELFGFITGTLDYDPPAPLEAMPDVFIARPK